VKSIWWFVVVCSLPLTGSKVNTRYMPSIGNGYIGATIYDDSIFLNGVYAGSGGQLCGLLCVLLVVRVEQLAVCMSRCVSVCMQAITPV